MQDARCWMSEFNYKVDLIKFTNSQELNIQLLKYLIPISSSIDKVFDIITDA